jgi:hypothetical protein
VLIDHNTVFDPRGSAPAFLYWTQSPVSGMKITNNILFYTGNMQAIRGENVSPGCGGLSDKALMDCAFTSGPGHPDYVFSNNVIVPSWTDSTNPTSTIPRFTVTDAFPSSLKNVVPNGNSMTAILGNIKFAKANATGTYQDLDLRLAAQSPYLATSLDGTQAGANMELLQQAQARILQLRALNVTSTTATLAAFVPETGAKCYVGYGTNEAAGTWTWTPADTTASRERNFAITGLTPGTRYFYSMVCAHTAMPSVEMLRTQ